MAVGPRINVDGHVFRTERELRLYYGLLDLARAGRLTKLQVNPEYLLTVNNKMIATFTPTFQFRDEQGLLRTISVKGPSPSASTVLKEKLYEALFDTTVERWG